MNNSFDMKNFLSDKRVQAEIERHLWIESEKAGRNIGYEAAKLDWLKRFSATWMQYNMPELVAPAPAPVKAAPAKVAVSVAPAKVAVAAPQRKKAVLKKPAAIRRRRAKSYV